MTDIDYNSLLHSCNSNKMCADFLVSTFVQFITRIPEYQKIQKNEDRGPRTGDSGLRIEDRGLKIPDLGPRNEDHRMRIEDHGLRIKD